MKKTMTLFLCFGLSSTYAASLLQEICEKTQPLEIISKSYEVRPEMIRYITESVKMDLVEYITYKTNMVKYLRQACTLIESEDITTGRSALLLRRKMLESAISAFIMLNPKTSVTETKDLDHMIFMSQTDRFAELNPLRRRLLNKERLF